MKKIFADKLRKRFFAVILVLLLTVPAVASAADVTVAWDPSPSASEYPGLKYKVYFGTASRSYGQPLDAGQLLQLKVTDLTPGTTYYLAATAYTDDGNESVYSEEISYKVPPRHLARGKPRIIWLNWNGQIIGVIK